MQVEWYGQSAFRLTGPAIGPCSSIRSETCPGLAARGLQFDYPPIDGVRGRPRCSSPTSTRTTTASRRSPARPPCCGRPRVGSTRRSAKSWPSPPSTTAWPGPSADPTRSSCSSSTAAGVPLRRLRSGRAAATSRSAAIGAVDLLFLPVGGGPTIGAEQAASIAQRAGARVGRADALPHAEDRLSRDGGRVPGLDGQRAAAGYQLVRDQRARRHGGAARAGSRRALERATDRLATAAEPASWQRPAPPPRPSPVPG